MERRAEGAIAAAALLAGTALACPAAAQSQVAPGEAKLLIEEFQFSISTDDGIASFGDVAFSEADQTVMVDPAAPGPGQQPQNFYIRGPDQGAFGLRFTGGALRPLGDRQSTQTLTMNNFKTDPPGPYQLFEGEATISVGADLLIPGGSPLGTYIGTYTVTVVNQ